MPSRLHGAWAPQALPRASYLPWAGRSTFEFSAPRQRRARSVELDQITNFTAVKAKVA